MCRDALSLHEAERAGLSEVNRKRGLIGGSGHTRRKMGIPCSEFDTFLFLDPLSTPDDRESLNSYLAHDRIELEIGPGRGKFISDTAYNRPDTRFIAIETRTKYCHLVLKKLENASVKNARLIQGDIRELLPELFALDSLDIVYLLFPDPWWKKRHGKRRVATPEFLDLVVSRLKPGGLIVFRSDVLPYVERMQEILEAQVDLAVGGELPDGVAMTHREGKCNEFGIPTW